MNQISPMAELPDDVSFVRRTEDFTADTVPPGLLRGHRVAQGVWGKIKVLEGTVTFVVEETKDRQDVHAGESTVILPGVVHHVEPSKNARFAIEFYR